MSASDVVHLPTSLAQQRFWFLQSLEPKSPVFNVHVGLRLDGDFDETALCSALQDLVDRHESLRTAIVSDGGVPVQRVYAQMQVPVAARDLTNLSASDREEAMRDAVCAQASTPFDLSAAPLVRAQLLRMSPKQRVLAVTLHHAAADGWSVRVLLGELSLAYSARVAGRRPDFGELPLQAGDVAVWERERLESGALGEQLARCRDRLAGAPRSLNLPTERARGQVRRAEGGRVPFRLDRQQASALRAAAARAHATLFAFVLAAFQLVLHRSTGQRDLVVGCPTSGRRRPDLAGVVGCFVNILPVRTQLPPNLTVGQLIALTRDAALAALADQDVPFDTVIEAIGAGGDLSRTPLLEAAIVMQPSMDELLDIPGVAVTEVECDTGTAQFDLALHLREERGELVGHLEYARAILTPALVHRLARHLRCAVEALCGDPEQRVAAVPLLSPDERRKVIQLGSGTAATVGGSRIEDLVSLQALDAPQAIALNSWAGEVSYGALDAASRALARRLAAAGVCDEDRVGVFAERSPEMVMALLATMHAGAAYVPLDPEYPDARLEYMVADAGCSAIVADQARLRRAARFGVPVVEARVGSSSEDPAIPAPSGARSPDGLCYVMYTSGSTGRPKGVAVPHRGVTNRLHWGQRMWPLTGEDRVLHKTPFTFDVSVWELLWPLSAGATVVLARPGGHRDAAYVADLLARERVSVVHFVPSMLRTFLERTNTLRLPYLERVFCSGEALPRDLVELFHRRTGAELHNLYGPTEASIEVSWCPCDPDEPDAPVPIGRPIQNIQLYVLDEELEPVPIGVRGELHIGGTAVVRGYWRRPALTAWRFVPDPFGRPAGRLFRSGDWARWRENGSLEFLGRMDDQVKVRGMRVEPGEIEATLRGHGGVEDAAVVLAPQPSGHHALVAAVIAREMVAGDALRRELHELARRELPPYMVPWRVLLLDQLPRTPSGKVDVRTLGELAASEVPSEGTALAPRTELEARLAAIVGDVLRIEPPAVDADFFALGGNSLLAMQVLARIEAAERVRVRPQALFAAPTVAGLARCVVEGEPVDSVGPVRPIEHPEQAEARELLERIDELSDEEVERLLKQVGGS